MMIHYTLLFTVPTAVALYYYNPQSDDDIRKAVVRTVVYSSPIQAPGGAADGELFRLTTWIIALFPQEAKVKPDAERRRKHQAKFAELLLQRGDVSQESQKQLDDVTSFAKRDK